MWFDSTLDPWLWLVQAAVGDSPPAWAAAVTLLGVVAVATAWRIGSRARTESPACEVETCDSDVARGHHTETTGGDRS